jgi:hypothetical protein
MHIKFSVSRSSPAGPVILAHVSAFGLSQQVTLLPEQARDIYRALGEALLEAGKAPTCAVGCGSDV